MRDITPWLSENVSEAMEKPWEFRGKPWKTKLKLT
jgi:hypothetical protein